MISIELVKSFLRRSYKRQQVAFPEASRQGDDARRNKVMAIHHEAGTRKVNEKMQEAELQSSTDGSRGPEPVQIQKLL